MMTRSSGAPDSARLSWKPEAGHLPSQDLLERAQDVDHRPDRGDGHHQFPKLQCDGELKQVPPRETAARAPAPSLPEVCSNNTLFAQVDESVLRLPDKPSDLGERPDSVGNHHGDIYYLLSTRCLPLPAPHDTLPEASPSRSADIRSTRRSLHPHSSLMKPDRPQSGGSRKGGYRGDQ